MFNNNNILNNASTIKKEVSFSIVKENDEI